MVLRIRDNKERVNLFLEYFDCTYEVKPRTPFNQPDVLTMNFYYAQEPTCARTDTLTPSSYCCH